jgi:Bacterial Ig-like domain (group 2)
MAIGHGFRGKRLPSALAFGALVVAAFGLSCSGFFVAPTLTSLTINPTAPAVQLGQTITVSAYGVNSNGQGSYLTSGVSWSSSDETIATVSGSGSATVTGVAIGTATLTASSQSVTNTATATVYITISSMAISPTSQSISAVGGTTPLPYVITVQPGSVDISSSATLTAYQSGTQTSNVTCTYYTSNPSGGTGGAGQYCTASATGTYQLVASYTGTTITATASLNVQ